MSAVTVADLVILDYDDLVAGKDLSADIARAYGFDGIGVLGVKNVPGFTDARARMLPLAQKFAALPDDVKVKYELPESFYSFGWSHGKERLMEGRFDVSKGSYYGNPQYDRPVEDEEVIKAYPSFVHPNIWPTADMPDLEPAFKQLGQIIVKVGTMIGRQCDTYVKSVCPSYETGKLERIISESLCCKARLLHYFALPDGEAQAAAADDFSNWCGWHNDHGSLTGLTPAMFMDLAGNEVDCPDPEAGLYAMTRHSQLVKINIPKNIMGFQIGECAQVHSGGILQATPHAVRGSRLPGISRESYAVFMEPIWSEPMTCPSELDPAQAQSQSAAANLPQGVPPLASRWKALDSKVQTFGEFAEVTQQAYY